MDEIGILKKNAVREHLHNEKFLKRRVMITLYKKIWVRL